MDNIQHMSWCFRVVCLGGDTVDAARGHWCLQCLQQLLSISTNLKIDPRSKIEENFYMKILVHALYHVKETILITNNIWPDPYLTYTNQS